MIEWLKNKNLFFILFAIYILGMSYFGILKVMGWDPFLLGIISLVLGFGTANFVMIPVAEYFYSDNFDFTLLTWGVAIFVTSIMKIFR